MMLPLLRVPTITPRLTKVASSGRVAPAHLLNTSPPTECAHA